MGPDSTPDSDPDRSMLVDRYLPAFDVTTSRHTLVGPFAGYLLSRALERAKADAERRVGTTRGR